MKEGETVKPPPCTECGIERFYPQSSLPVVIPGTIMWPWYQMESTGQLGVVPVSSSESSSAPESDAPIIADGIVGQHTQAELYLLFKYLEATTSTLPNTVYPLPLLHRRAARLYAENRAINYPITNIILHHLHESLFAYDMMSTAVASPITCALYIQILQTRLAQLTCISKTRHMSPRIQKLRETVRRKALISPHQLQGMLWLIKGEAEEAEEWMQAVYGECKGDLWERYCRVKTPLIMMLKIVDPKVS